MKGYIKDFRKELQSDIWFMPPLYHRVWQYLKYKVNHKDNKIPMNDGSFLTVKAGQHLTSIRTIANNVGWYERGVFKTPNPKTISSILDWLEKQQMIKIDRGKSNRQYTLITLINWNLYQSDDDESNSKETAKKQSMDINNNDKNEKNDKKEDYTSKIKDLLTFYASKIPGFIELNKQYWDVIRETRTTGKVAESVIYKNMKKWEKYDPAVIEYALKSHIDLHAGKKEEYTIGIMRNTSKEEAIDRLSLKKPKGKVIKMPNYEVDDVETSNGKHSEESGHVRLFR